MKFFAVLAVVVASAIAAEIPIYRTAEYDVPIIRAEYDASPDGATYHHAFEAGNGIVQQADGVLKTVDSESVGYQVTGLSSYTSPEGVPVRLTYVANEFGYQPSGDHIPVPPAIPEAILRGLAYIAAHPAPVVEYQKFVTKQ